MHYLNARPFPHTIIEGLIPTEILEGVLSAFPSQFDREWDNRLEKKRARNTDLPTEAQRLVDYCHSGSFLFYLEKLTGIKDLVPDKSLVGGGYHELPVGGFLGMHTDFTINKELGLYRRLNLLVYLNKGWGEDDGGELFLGKDCKMKILPEFGRCVLFSTTSESWHGNPNPTKKPRRSFAFYYYSPDSPDGDYVDRDTRFL